MLARLVSVAGLSCVLLVSPVKAYATSETGRSFGIFGGAGLSRQLASVEQPNVDAKLKGWANFAEVGIDLPFSDNFGFSPSVEISESELTNDRQSATYLDRTTVTAQTVRGLFYYKGFSVGGSFKKLEIDLKTVSSTNGASSASLSGNGNSVFVGYSFVYRGVLRTTVEAEMMKYESANFNLQDTSVGIRLHLLFGGIFGS